MFSASEAAALFRVVDLGDPVWMVEGAAHVVIVVTGQTLWVRVAVTVTVTSASVHDALARPKAAEARKRDTERIMNEWTQANELADKKSDLVSRTTA